MKYIEIMLSLAQIVLSLVTIVIAIKILKKR